MDLRYLKLEELKASGYDMGNRPGTTEFTYSRFLIPHLMGYEGLALFMDCDILAMTDVTELEHLPMDEFAIRCVQHDYRPTETIKMDGQPQVQYIRKNWSSVMLLNCSKLQCWTKEVVETASGARLHRFEDVPDDQIGHLEPRWNSLDKLEPNTALWHLTSGGPYLAECRNCPHAEVWWQAYADYCRETTTEPREDFLPFLEAFQP